jgi:hypothetical protein
MKTFYLFCQVFYGPIAPEFTPQELSLLSGCEETYATLALCTSELSKVQKVKHQDVTIIPSCGPKE